MPGVFQQSADQIVEECREVESLGIPGVILFGLPEKKDPRGISSIAADGVVQRAIEAIRKARLKLLVITDVCLCEYTDHGHCGVIEDGEVANDATLDILAEQAVSHARAGADIVAPSDMMDGRVGVIREALDEHKFENISILDIANTVAKHVKADIIVTPSNDPRSYRVNSDRLLATGFRPKKTVEDAIKEIIGMYSQGQLKNEDRWYNLKWMERM